MSPVSRACRRSSRAWASWLSAVRSVSAVLRSDASAVARFAARESVAVAQAFRRVLQRAGQSLGVGAHLLQAVGQRGQLALQLVVVGAHPNHAELARAWLMLSVTLACFSSMDAASAPMAFSAVSRFASRVSSWAMMRSRAPMAGLDRIGAGQGVAHGLVGLRKALHVRTASG